MLFIPTTPPMLLTQMYKTSIVVKNLPVPDGTTVRFSIRNLGGLLSGADVTSFFSSENNVIVRDRTARWDIVPKHSTSVLSSKHERSRFLNINESKRKDDKAQHQLAITYNNITWVYKTGLLVRGRSKNAMSAAPHISKIDIGT